MLSVRTLLSPLRALVAVAAIAAATAPAQAGLTLFYSGPGAAGSIDFSGGATDVTGSQVAGVSSSITTFNGYSFAYTVSSAFVGNVQSVTLTGTLSTTARSNAGQTFNFILVGGMYNAPTGSQSIVTAQLKNVSVTGAVAGLTQVTTDAALNGNPSATAMLLDRASTNGSQSFADQSTSGAGGPLAPGFTLASIDASVTGDGVVGSTVTFTSVALVAVPAPPGLVAGILGLPCVGAFLGFARRRVGLSAQAV